MLRLPSTRGAAARNIPAFSRAMASERGAEELLMIEADADNHGDVGIDRR